MQIKHNVFQLFVALDQFLNVLIGMIIEPSQKQWSDLTLSAHTWIHYTRGEWCWFYWLVNHIFFWQNNHCKEAYESEAQRSHLPPELRTNETIMR